MFQYEARIIRVVDGDTLWLDVDLGFRVHLQIDVRLAGINTPDTLNYGATGINDPARDYVAEAVPVGSICVVEITKPEKYGRWLARVLFQPGEVNRSNILANPRVLNDELVRKGLAKKYSGGRK